MHCTCKMALSMAPQAFISTIDNALYALRLKRADWTGRLDLPSGSLMSAFRAGPASDNTQLSSYRRASNPLCPLKNKMGVGLNRLPFVSGRLDLNQRLQVPQTCTLNPCATARCSNKIAQQSFYVKSKRYPPCFLVNDSLKNDKTYVFIK